MASAQSAAPRTITGTTRDEAGLPVPLAQVSVRPSGPEATADSLGRFTVVGLAARAYDVVVRALGFKAVMVTARLDSAETVALEVRLVRLPQALAEIRVQATRDSSFYMRGFYIRRRTQGQGRFITREDIERSQARVVSDIIRRVPGVTVMPDRGGRLVAVNNRNARSGNCPLRLYIEGVPFEHPSFGLDDWFLPDDIAGIEVYADGATVPPQFGDVVRACGSILIWLRG